MKNHLPEWYGLAVGIKKQNPKNLRGLVMWPSEKLKLSLTTVIDCQKDLGGGDSLTHSPLAYCLE